MLIPQLTLFTRFCSAVLMIAAFLSSAVCAVRAAVEFPVWQQYDMALGNSTVTVIHPDTMTSERARIQWLIVTADRSTVTRDPIGTNVRGLVKERDFFVVTNDLLLWFNCNSPASVSTNGGGGLLRGLWTLRLDGSNSLNFKRIVNDKNYAPSFLYAGSAPGVQGSGISLLGNFGQQNVDNGVTFAIEHEHAPIATTLTGQLITTGTHTGGVVVQFTGFLGNSSLPQHQLNQMGLDDHYDCDTRAGITGRCEYLLTYKIPLSGERFRQEITLNVTQNNFGPAATMVLSHNIAGYPTQPATFVSVPQLQGGGLVSDSSQYFKTQGLDLNFHTLPWSSRPGTNHWWEPPVGTGSLAGVGLPTAAHPVPFFTYRPDIAALPSALQTTYALQAIDNQGANAAHRCLALDLQLWDVNRGTPPRTFPQGSALDIITNYELRYPGESRVAVEDWIMGEPQLEVRTLPTT